MEIKIKREEFRCVRCGKDGVYVGIINNYHQCYCDNCEGWWIVEIEE